jgi:excisionase family DNA binding protein
MEENSITIDKKTVFNTREAASFLSCTTGTLLRYVREKRIPACKIGERKYLYSRRSLELLIESGKPLLKNNNTTNIDA